MATALSWWRRCCGVANAAVLPGTFIPELSWVLIVFVLRFTLQKEGSENRARERESVRERESERERERVRAQERDTGEESKPGSEPGRKIGRKIDR